MARRAQAGAAQLGDPSHHWAGEEEHPAAALPLNRGAYEVTAELVQPAPEFRNEEEIRRQHTGFQVKYCGPDSSGRRTEIPHSALFTVRKDQPLGAGIKGLSPGAAAYLDGQYDSSLRDIRRSYQRAFKALLFCRRLGLSARREPHGTSELGYLLGQPQLFAGIGYYRGAGGFTRHAAYLDFDFLPLRDDYYAPAPGTDARTDPSPQRVQAMFDWWERLFDYAAARADVRRRSGRPLWHLFEEAQEKQPATPGYLLRHLAADARHWQLDLRYFQGQNAPVYEVTSADLTDERWTLRAWHADRWLRAAQDRFTVPDIETARPDLWASDDPSAKLPGETQTGNASLLTFVTDGYLQNGTPRRREDLRRVNDGLRDRGRRALIAYLCRHKRVPLPWQPGTYATAPGDRCDLLLLDVEAGLREKASRIEEAITAAQSFIRRSQLGLEPSWTVTREFARLWDSRFETYRTWERARRRELYPENWIEWDELARARHIEAFRFLESQLRSSMLTLAAPGGLDWWADDDRALDRAPELLQRRVPSELTALPASPPTTTSGGVTTQPTTREGFTTLGRPEFAAQPTWLTAVPQPAPAGGSGGTNGSGGSGGTDGSGPEVVAGPGHTGTARSLAAAAAAGSTQPESLPLWLESAMKLGARFVRVAAAGVPEAALGFVPRGEEPRGACCPECGRDHPAGVDEHYFWLIDTHVYTNPADSSSSPDGDASFAGTYQFGFQDPYYDQFQQQSAEWNDPDRVPALLARWQPGPAVRLAWCRVHNGQFGQPRRSEQYVALAPGKQPDLVFQRAGLGFAVP
ncbi:MAG: neuraminidase-like domain-containing protein [Trebonia sp.]